MRRRYVHIPFTVTLGALGLSVLVLCIGARPDDPPATVSLAPVSAEQPASLIGAG